MIFAIPPRFALSFRYSRLYICKTSYKSLASLTSLGVHASRETRDVIVLLIWREYLAGETLLQISAFALIKRRVKSVLLCVGKNTSGEVSLVGNAY